MLEDYAMKHGFTNLVHFTDDGWSGATFDRPSWNRLVAEHERIAEEKSSDSNVCVEQNATSKSNRQKVKGEKIA